MFNFYKTNYDIRGGYEKEDKASDKAIKYMEWFAKKRKVHVLHAGNGREHKIKNWKVDGYVPTQKLVIEFLGQYTFITLRHI